MSLELSENEEGLVLLDVDKLSMLYNITEPLTVNTRFAHISELQVLVKIWSFILRVDGLDVKLTYTSEDKATKEFSLIAEAKKQGEII